MPSQHCSSLRLFPRGPKIVSKSYTFQHEQYEGGLGPFDEILDSPPPLMPNWKRSVASNRFVTFWNGGTHTYCLTFGLAISTILLNSPEELIRVGRVRTACNENLAFDILSLKVKWSVWQLKSAQAAALKLSNGQPLCCCWAEFQILQLPLMRKGLLSK